MIDEKKLIEDLNRAKSNCNHFYELIFFDGVMAIVENQSKIDYESLIKDRDYWKVEAIKDKAKLGEIRILDAIKESKNNMTKTNFDVITESVESLAKFIDIITYECSRALCETCKIGKALNVGCCSKLDIIKYLNQKAESVNHNENQ
jgi:hypothetical protein